MHSRTATIVDTYLGYWCEDVLVAFLLVDFGGVIRAIGGHLRNAADAAANRAFGEQFALRLMRACDAHRWDELDGRTVEVLFDAPFPWGNAVGVRRGGAPDEEPFLFAELTGAPAADDQQGGESLESVGAPRPLQAPPSSRVSAI